MDLPGRPAGNADHLSSGAAAWEHLAWEIWNLERQLDQRVCTLLKGWSGPGAEAFATRWTKAQQGFPELDHHLHTVADRLRIIALTIQDGQEEYDQTLAQAGVIGVVGIAATLVTVGGSDLLAGEADAALAASLAGKVAELGLDLARLGRLLSDLAEALGKLASRFAMDLAIRGPEFAFGPAGGAAVGVGLSLASGSRDPGDLAASGLMGAAENVGGGRRGSGAEAKDAEGEPPLRGPSSRPLDPVEEAWRASLSPVQAAKQAEFDREAAERADPGGYGAINDPLVGPLARAINVRLPGSVQFINRRIVNPAAERVEELTDLDIETEEAVIQVKSGSTARLDIQLSRSGMVSSKPVIAFAPRMSNTRWAWYREHGYVVFRDESSLLSYLQSEH